MDAGGAGDLLAGDGDHDRVEVLDQLALSAVAAAQFAQLLAARHATRLRPAQLRRREALVDFKHPLGNIRRTSGALIL